MTRVIKVQTRPDWRLFVEFSDGVSGELALEDRLFGPVFEPLRDPAVFSQAYVDEFGAVCWPNGADLAPDALHDRIVARLKVSCEQATMREF